MSRYEPRRQLSSYAVQALGYVVLAAYGGRLAWSLLSPLVDYAFAGLVLIFVWRFTFSRY